MIVLSPIQERILLNIGRYKFLVSKQMQKLIGNKNIQTIYNDLRTLKERGFVNCVVYGGVTKSGTMHKLYYLTAKGAKVVAEIMRVGLDKVKYPKSTNTLVKNDYFHRIFTIDAMISFDLWTEDFDRDVLFFDVYFDKVGSQRGGSVGTLQTKTRIKIGEDSYIDPDGIFAYRTIQGDKLFVLEVANGVDTKRIVKQLKNVVFASYEGIISEKYGVKTTPKVLLIFEHESTLQAVVSRVANDEYLNRFEELKNYVFISTHAQVSQDWRDSWRNIEGEATRPFD